MFSCLVLCEGNHSQFLSKILKCIFGKRFCKDIYYPAPLWQYIPTWQFFVMCSLKKRYLIRICFEFECIIGFFEIFMALVLSHNIGFRSLYSILISCNVYFIQKICVQQVVATMYSTNSINREIEDYFFLNHDSRKFPRKNTPPLVLFLSSTLLVQSASM